VAITGHGPSGWGSSRGAEGLLAMTRPVFVTRTGRLRPPAGPLDQSMMTRIRSSLGWLYGRAVKLDLGPEPAAPLADGSGESG
jgi:hypothetical protein